jgi:hypothetical protein
MDVHAHLRTRTVPALCVPAARQLTIRITAGSAVALYHQRRSYRTMLFSVSTLDHGLDGDQIHLRSGLCPVPLRPEVHLRRHHRRCRHTAGVLQFREFFAGDVGSRFAHATAFDATYQQTPELPENHPTIVGSVWEQEILFLWMAILFCTAVAVAQCLASSALFSRFKWYNLGLPRRADFVAGYAARTSCQRFMPQAQSLAFR